MDSNKIVYLEDVEPARESPKQTETTATKVAPTTNDASSENAGIKRQLSIADMFSKVSSETSSKRQKVEKDGSVQGTSSSLAPLNSVPLNVEAFRASLTEEVRELLELELDTMGRSWLKVLTDEIKKPYFVSLKRWLASEGLTLDAAKASQTKTKIFPPAKEIYSWSRTPLGRVRVVIIGQDPYHGPGQAHGLSFSVPKGVPPPPSLINIYAEVKAEYPDFEPPKHGNLASWASNGVLLLNTCLTVRAHKAGSHSNKGWEQFTDRVVDVIDRYGGASIGSRSGDSPCEKRGIGRGVVFLAWGAWAQKRVARLDKKKHLILTSAHPSPLSASRGFFGNNHFQAANAWLEKKYGKDGIVDWCKLD